MRIDFKDLNNPYPWVRTQNVYIRGYALYKKKIYRGNDFAALFDNSNLENNLKILNDLDGIFSIVIIDEKSMYLITDRLRSFPLFYKLDDCGWHISDHIDFKTIKNTKENKTARKQFSYSLMTFADATICEGIYQVESGQCVELGMEDNKVKRNYWWEFKYSGNLIKNRDKAISMLDNAYKETFKQLVTLLRGRTAVIPLSGGHDSRLIAFYLKALGYSNVISFSYGKSENEESLIAKRVAQYLDIPFYFVEYKRKAIRKWANEKLIDYLEYSGNASSVPCPQEAYAVYELKSRKIIGEDAVFIPGYSGDFLAGSHLDENIFITDTLSENQLKYSIIKRHMTGNAVVHQDELKTLMKYLNSIDYLNVGQDFSCDKFAELYERFDMMERQSKFIVNAARSYEYYGYEWLVPEFDLIQLNLWLSIAPQLRLNRNVYFQFERGIYPKKFQDIPFAGVIQKNKIRRITDKINTYSPFPWSRTSHYLFMMSEIRDYMKCVYIDKNRNVDYWFYKKYMELIM